MKLALFIRTLRTLRPTQLFYLLLRRIQVRLPPRVPTPHARLMTQSLAPAVRRLGVDREESVVERAEAVIRQEFRFLNRTETIRKIEWRRRYVNDLWSYNLHYFDYVRDLAWAHRWSGDDRYVEAFVELALSWIRGTEPGAGYGWQPYPVSLRVVNWLYALSLMGDAIPEEASLQIGESAAVQAAWLERRLEHHLRANHLQKNYHALAVAGFFFTGPDAERWRDHGLRGSWDAVREQVLEDGGHYERSPMYHAIALQDFLEILTLCEAAAQQVPEDVVRRVGQMARAMGVFYRESGALHLFNDAAEGLAPTRAHLADLSRRVFPEMLPQSAALAAAVSPGFELLDLPRTGYYGIDDTKSGDRLLVDCGPPGPRDQPGHAHCDTLSFELDLAAKPFAVDAGVHGYEGDPFREYTRSTRAHNTVSIDGREQHEVWGTFRMARRGRLLSRGQALSRGGYCFQGAFSPYHDRGFTHYRRIERKAEGWRVTDRVDGATGIKLESFLHIHPDWTVCCDGAEARAVAGDLKVTIELFGIDDLRLESGVMEPVQGWYCPEFGIAIAAPVLVMTVQANDGRRFGYSIRPVNG